MPQSREKLGLMAVAAMVLFGVMVSVMMSNGGVEERAVNGVTSARRTAGGEEGRRLQAATYDFATQLEMTVCLTADHSVASAKISAEEFQAAVLTVLELDNPDFVLVDDSVTRCLVDSWQRRVSVYNEGDDTGTAADIASRQVDSIYLDPGTDQFFTDISEAINAKNSELDPEAADFNLESLGFLVIWLDSSGEVVSSQGTSSTKDVVTIGGTEVWWPWWAWLIYAAIVLCCICPMLFFFFKWRRDKEAETEGFGGQGKELGTPAPPSATSTNPYGANYASGEEYKNGKN